MIRAIRKRVFLLALFMMMITATTPVLAAGWVKDNVGWWYDIDGTSYPKASWYMVDNTWYYFDARGYMETGFVSDNTATYYCTESGAMVTGWQQIYGYWYYFAGSGAMVKNQWVGDYYLLDSGRMATNRSIDGYWVDENGKWDKNHFAFSGSTGSGTSSSTGSSSSAETIKADYKDKVRSEALTVAGSLASEGNYADAIEQINTAIKKIGNDEELVTRRTIYEISYKDDIMSRIDSTYKNSGVEAVVALLKKAIAVVPNDEELQREYDTWKSRIPVGLTTLDYYTKTGYLYIDRDNDGDNYGTVYDSNIMGVILYHQPASVEYYLDGKYNSLTGVIYVSERAKRLQADISDDVIYIYGDGILLASYSGFTYKDKPQKMNVDISGVEFLKISFGTERLIGVGNPYVGW